MITRASTGAAALRRWTPVKQTVQVLSLLSQCCSRATVWTRSNLFLDAIRPTAPFQGKIRWPTVRTVRGDTALALQEGFGLTEQVLIRSFESLKIVHLNTARRFTRLFVKFVVSLLLWPLRARRPVLYSRSRPQKHILIR